MADEIVQELRVAKLPHSVRVGYNRTLIFCVPRTRARRQAVKLMIAGGGAREHAIAKKAKEGSLADEVF
ncbi:MAG: hypothetical protein Q8P12_05270, partial [bacterium]|nr:hypothetical protein [bacterium]